MLSKAWKFIKPFWDFLAAVGGFIGVLFLAQDVHDLPEALRKWRGFMNISDQTFWMMFAFVLVLYIGWMDARPYVKKWGSIRLTYHFS